MPKEGPIADLLLEAAVFKAARGLADLKESGRLEDTDGAAAHMGERPASRATATVPSLSPTEKLYDTAATVAHTPRPPPADAIGSTAKQPVLVVEDIRATANVLKYSLETEGFEVLLAAIGLEMAKRELPNFIVTDYHTPDMDGAALARDLRADPSTRSIAVLMPTSDGGVAREPLVLGAGGYHYILNPVAPRSLAARVKSVLARAKDRQFVAAT
jgi:CheY-like chemotaxis protein